MASPVLVPRAPLSSNITQPRLLSFIDVSAARKSHCRTIQCNWRDEIRFFRGALEPLSVGREGKYVQWARSCEAKKRRALIANSAIPQQQSSRLEAVEGLDWSDIVPPVEICDIQSLKPAISLKEAMVTLSLAISKLEDHPPRSASGTLRFQVPLPSDMKALQWLQSQPQTPALLPRSYFSPRLARETENGEMGSGYSREGLKRDVIGVGAVAGVGAAALFNGSESFSMKDWKTIKRFLSKQHSIIRAYGAMRFDQKLKPTKEWHPFGSFYFFIPQIEFCECEDYSLLAVTLTWDLRMGWTLMKALQNARTVMQMVSTRISPDEERRLPEVTKREHVPNEQSWHEEINKTLDSLSSQGVQYSDPVQKTTHDAPALFKVVMARRTKLELTEQVDPMRLLACLQDKDPSAYQFAIQVPDGSAFIGCSPERLFVRDGLVVASEAVAGTRARGSTTSEDLQLGTELMRSTKDHFEFEIVRESIKHRMQTVCKRATIGSSKSLLKQARVQHLYARINGVLHDDIGEFDLLSALHPTPAVCGLPQARAREVISSSEAFDRGLYAGPVGWFSGDGAEFAVGIRSSLIQPWPSSRQQNGTAVSNNGSMLEVLTSGPEKVSTGLQNLSKSLPKGEQGRSKSTCTKVGINLYAGVGVVKDSVPASEWRELNLKISQFEALLDKASS